MPSFRKIETSPNLNQRIQIHSPDWTFLNIYRAININRGSISRANQFCRFWFRFYFTFFFFFWRYIISYRKLLIVSEWISDSSFLSTVCTSILYSLLSINATYIFEIVVLVAWVTIVLAPKWILKKHLAINHTFTIMFLRSFFQRFSPNQLPYNLKSITKKE